MDLLRKDIRLYLYLQKEWQYNNHRKYHKLFDEWVENITERQILYFTAQMYGKMSIY